MILFKTTKLWFYHGSQKLMKQKSWTASSMERSIVQGEIVKNIAHLLIEFFLLKAYELFAKTFFHQSQKFKSFCDGT